MMADGERRAYGAFEREDNTEELYAKSQTECNQRVTLSRSLKIPWQEDTRCYSLDSSFD